jgi:hypothetical protein
MGTEFSEDMALWIVERAETRRTEWAAKKAREEQFRAERKTARDAGLVARHARKLAHIKASRSIA